MSSPLPASLMSQLAASTTGFDPAPVINAGEQQLTNYLAMPTQQLLNHFDVQVPNSALAAPANHGGGMNQFDPMQMINPVMQALTTLGSGGFPPGMDPTSMLNQISSTLGGTAGPLQQALSAATQGWQGASSAAAAAKMGTALANSAEVATQANGLQSSLTAAVNEVAQAQARLMEIIHEYMATLTASLPFLPFSLPTIVAAASQAVTQTTQVMTETQSSLAAQASAVTAIGTPVNVTSAPQAGAAGAGALGGLGSMLGLGSSSGSSAASSAMSPMSALSSASPLMYLASAGMSPIMSAVSAAGRGGNPAGVDPAAALADATAPDPNAAAAAGALGSGAVAPVAHGGGGGAATAPSAAPAPRFTAPTIPAHEPPMLGAPTRPAGGGMPMGGGGMMGAPLGGAGQAGAAGGGAHTAASFLHTSDQGGKVVGGRTTVAPPVLGEVDPYDIPDIELRI